MIPTTPEYDEQYIQLYGSYLDRVRKRCSDCEGEGHISWVDGDGYDMARDCECTRNAKRYLAYLRGNLPKTHRVKPKFDIMEAQAAPYIARFIESWDVSMLMYGPNGTGKTTAACYILREAVKKGRSVFRIESTEMLRAFSLKKSRMWWIDKWLEEGMFSDVVCVDELGAEASKLFQSQEVAYALMYYVKHRHEQGKPSILCTNLDRDKFKDAYGETIASVVVGGGFINAALVGEDWRAGGAR